jgi:putative membrane protein (TIGR04086 family)
MVGKPSFPSCSFTTVMLFMSENEHIPTDKLIPCSRRKGGNFVKEDLMNAAKKGWKSPWIAGQLIIWLIVFILSVCTALLLRFTSLETSHLPTITFFINVISLFLGGWISGKKAGQKGWFYGGMQGIIYCLLLVLISFLAFDASMRVSPFVFGVCAFGVSALGGIFGVNWGK